MFNHPSQLCFIKLFPIGFLISFAHGYYANEALASMDRKSHAGNASNYYIGSHKLLYYMGGIKLTDTVVDPSLIHVDFYRDGIVGLYGEFFPRPEIVVSADGGGKACFRWVVGSGLKVCSTFLLGMITLDHLEYHVISRQTELDLS